MPGEKTATKLADNIHIDRNMEEKHAVKMFVRGLFYSIGGNNNIQ